MWIQDPFGNPINSVQGGLNVAPPGSALFNDTFDSTTLDTTYRYNAAVTANGGTITIASGVMSAATSTAASAAAAVSSLESFTPVGAGIVQFATAVTMEAAPSINTHRFWGLGTPGVSFTAATPLTDAVGFELDVTGSFNACIYAGGVRVWKQAMTLPVGGVSTQLLIFNRPDFTEFFMNNTAQPAAVVAMIGPNVDTLPLRFHLINGTTGPSAAPTWQNNGFSIIDSASNIGLAFNGQTVSRQRSPGKFVNINSLSVAAQAAIWTPATGRRFRLLGYLLTVTGAGGNVTLQDGVGTTILTIPFGATGATILSPGYGNGLLSAAVNNSLYATGQASQVLSGHVFGCEE